MASLLKCVFGPRLKKMLKQGSIDSKYYEPNIAEKCGDQVIRSLSIMWSLGVYTSPVIACVLYKKGYLTIEGVASILKFVAAVGLVLLGSLCLRGIGRFNNVDYTSFLLVLQDAQVNLNKETKKALLRYDFDFYAWPAEFRWSDTQTDESKPRTFLSSKTPRRKSIWERIKAVPCQLIGYTIANTFGRRMVYPGTISLLQAAMSPMLLQGRCKLIEDYDGERVKLISRDENAIDIMVVDRRKNGSFRNRNTLVICSEGNAGFYEVGIMTTALEVGYSVIGWNHPGFGGSTGIPYPDQEANAIDVVMQYAIHQLGFQPSSIVLFAWSIGGYPATWAAMNYPEVKGIVLDATFDDLVPLAVSKMPSAMKPLVVSTVRDYLDLNNAEQLCRYPGPVLLIRRTEDEMITTEEPPTVASNRANDLLTKFLKCRYPKLIDEKCQLALKQWLEGDKLVQRELLVTYDVADDLCISTIASYLDEYQDLNSFGADLDQDGKIQMALFLAKMHMVDYNSTHCTPLPKQMFKLPWEPQPPQEHDFVKVNPKGFYPPHQ